MSKSKLGEESWEPVDYSERRSEVKQRKIDRRLKKISRRKQKRTTSYE